MVDWQEACAHNRPALRFGAIGIRRDGQDWVFDAEVWLGALAPDAVRVELTPTARRPPAHR